MFKKQLNKIHKQLICKIFQIFCLFGFTAYAQNQIDYKKLDSLTIAANETKSDSLKAEALYAIGNLYEDVNPSKAIEFYKKAYVVSLKLKSQFVKSNITNKLGTCYYFLSDYSNSLQFFIENLNTLTKIKNRSGVASCHNNIAIIYDELNDTVNALKHHMLALYIRKSLDQSKMANKDEVANSYGNIGKTYYSMNNLEKALMYYDLCLKLSEETKNKKRVALMYNNIGTVYATNKKLDEANSYFFKAYNLYKEIGINEKIAMCLINIAEVHYLKSEYPKAIEKYNEALKISRNRQSLDDVKSCYEGLHNVYLELKDYETAHEYLTYYYQVKDSIFNEESTSQINELLTKFDSEKKDQEIELLQKDKEITAWLKNSLIVGILFIIIVALLIFSRYKVKHRANLELASKNQRIEEQKHILELHQKEIVDSINYAKRIQFSLLSHVDTINAHLKSAFVLFKPKDIVSGDFYWTTQKNNLFYLAVCDSTGHGVPGAFMSLLNMGFLSEAINERNLLKPNEVFDFVREKLIKTISKEGQQDGFDGILICIDLDTKQITYSAAHNSPIIISNSEIIHLESDKMPVGKGVKELPFKLYSINIKDNDTLYLYTDGYADQFGGPKGKKFLYKNMNQLIASISHLSFIEQKTKLEDEFDKWKGNLEQVDDVLIIGIKI